MSGVKRRTMAEDDRRLQAATLGEIAGQEVDIFCWCNRCGHNTVLPSRDLIDRLGADTAVPEVGARLRCTQCGGKDVATQPAWPGLGQIAHHD
jgi:hypothetical protein